MNRKAILYDFIWGILMGLIVLAITLMASQIMCPTLGVLLNSEIGKSLDPQCAQENPWIFVAHQILLLLPLLFGIGYIVIGISARKENSK